MKFKITCRPRYNPWLKNISKLLTVGVLFNSIPFNSFAGTLSPDTRYETFEGSNITINDVLEEDELDIEIEGNTLVNLATKNSGTASEQNVIKLSYPTDKSIYIQLDCTSNTMESTTQFGLVIRANYSDGTSDCVGFEKDGKSTGILYIQLKNPDRKNIDSILIAPHVSTTSGDAEYKDLMILEGDWTNKEIPEYFEGMKSSFEDNLITQEMVDLGEEKAENLGKYKVKVKSTGKNLFDGKTLNDEWISIADNNIIPTSEGNKSTGWIKCKPNTSYTVQGGDRNRWALRNSKGEITVVGGVVGDETPTMTTLSDTVEFKCYVKWTDASSSISLESLLRNLQIEESSFMTDYEPYKESVNTFYLNSPLLKGDTIEIINGQLTHVRRYKQVILDGSENWAYEDVQGFNIGKFIWYTTLNAKPIQANTYPQDAYMCDKLQAIHWWTSEKRYDNSIYYGYFGDNITILKDEFNKDVSLLKQWLRENPVKFIYELNSPIYEPIKTDLSVQLFEGTTHITNNSNIPANMEMTVDRVLNRAAEAIELAKANPTIENISRARMWTNLAKESIKKDELQSEINNITDINDLQLERKSATANMDVYVKSENMLSMSLNTNSVTFDNYSGVEDMEILGAVNISINSSLPYDLNAYLPSEIANADKSEIMDIEMLKIKESSNVDYQNFVNTTDKIVLKGSCNAGNNLIHNIDLKLASNLAHKSDVYKTVIKFEAEQK